MRAKIVNVEKSDKAWWFDKYELECIECGTHYFRSKVDNRTNPYCAECTAKREREKRQEFIMLKIARGCIKFVTKEYVVYNREWLKDNYEKEFNLMRKVYKRR